MKISVELINSYLLNHLSTENLAEAIEHTEVEVEEILYADKLDSKIITAKVVSVSKHPNADKLNKVIVDNGTVNIDIVCGASNVTKGIMVALAQVGAILPDGSEIGEAEIRGEISKGMICSEKELGWGSDHDGIVVLDPSLLIGQSLCDIAKMTDIIDIKTPSNRWDYLSYLGLSREIAASDEGNKFIEPEPEKITYKNRELVDVNNIECKLYYSVKARVKADSKSPRWLVDNLQASGIRSINPVVDITNFVMLEYGQPSHAYDAKKIDGPIKVRLATIDENITTLDDKNIKLTDSDLVVVDNSGPIALAGVIGGSRTQTSGDSTEILIEIANFDKTITRRSALRHGLRTEASARFEKGLPLKLPSLAANRIIELLKDICGAYDIEANEQSYAPYPVSNLGLRLRKAEKFIGYKLDEKEVMNALSRRGFNPAHFSFKKEINAHIGKPYMYGAQLETEKLEKFDCSLLTSYIYSKAGLDIGRTAEMQFGKGMEVPETGLKPGDLLFLRGDEKQEDSKIAHVGMFVSAGKVLQASSVAGKVTFSPTTKFTKAKNFAGAKRYVDNFNHIISVGVPWWREDITSEADLFEEIAKTQDYNSMPETLPNFEPTSTADHQLLPSLMQLREKLIALGLMEIITYSFISKEDIENTKYVMSRHLQIENPLSSEQDYLRNSLLPSHLTAARNNLSSKYSAFFEVSRVHEKLVDGFDENWTLGITTWGDSSLLRLKGIIDSIVGWYGVGLDVKREDNSNVCISGRSAKLSKGLGYYGQIKPAILKSYKINPELSFAELNIKKIIDNNNLIIAKPLLPYQIIYKDITVELPQEVLYQDIAKNLEKSVLGIEFLYDYQDNDLKDLSRKRITIRVGLDLGPNPKTQDISTKVGALAVSLNSIQKSKVL
ncbi:MAG: phenylalanine--tRNA ligase beta subunit-related protein [Candidatus Saccharibacteria bacterium]